MGMNKKQLSFSARVELNRLRKYKELGMLEIFPDDVINRIFHFVYQNGIHTITRDISYLRQECIDRAYHKEVCNELVFCLDLANHTKPITHYKLSSSNFQALGNQSYQHHTDIQNPIIHEDLIPMKYDKIRGQTLIRSIEREIKNKEPTLFKENGAYIHMYYLLELARCSYNMGYDLYTEMTSRTKQRFHLTEILTSHISWKDDKLIGYEYPVQYAYNYEFDNWDNIVGKHMEYKLDIHDKYYGWEPDHKESFQLIEMWGEICSEYLHDYLEEHKIEIWKAGFFDYYIDSHLSTYYVGVNGVPEENEPINHDTKVYPIVEDPECLTSCLEFDAFPTFAQGVLIKYILKDVGGIRPKPTQVLINTKDEEGHGDTDEVSNCDLKAYLINNDIKYMKNTNDENMRLIFSNRTEYYADDNWKGYRYPFKKEFYDAVKKCPVAQQDKEFPFIGDSRQNIKETDMKDVPIVEYDCDNNSYELLCNPHFIKNRWREEMPIKYNLDFRYNESYEILGITH